MKEKTIQQRKALQYIVPLLLLAVLLIIHMGIQSDFGDDMVYRDVLKTRSLGEFLQRRYAGWSSRVLIEAIMVPFAGWNIWAWRIADSLMMAVFLWTVADLFGTSSGKTGSQVAFFVMCLTVPIAVWNNAGWVTTTINYLWALTLGLVALRPLKHWFTGEACRPWEYVVCTLCLIYAANMEQMAAILLGAYLVCGGYLLGKKRKLPLFYWVELTGIMASLAFILTAPGNAIRLEQETEKFLPYFGELNPAQKLWMGFLDTGNYYLAGGERTDNFVFGFFAGILLLVVLDSCIRGSAKDKSRAKKCGMILVAAVAPAFFWGIGRLGYWLLASGKLTRGRNGIGVLIQNRFLPGESYFSTGLVCFQTICYLAVLLAVIVTVVWLWRGSTELWLQLLILAAGLASRLIMGFSPTVYASGDRTAIFCTVALLIVALRNVRLLQSRGIKWVALSYTLLCVGSNLAASCL